jgi:hypothetical protein
VCTTATVKVVGIPKNLARGDTIMAVERLLVGWDEIGEHFRLSGKAFKKRFGAELLALGCVFRMRRGVPPRIYVCTWPSSLHLWVTLKQQHDEII